MIVGSISTVGRSGSGGRSARTVFSACPTSAMALNRSSRGFASARMTMPISAGGRFAPGPIGSASPFTISSIIAVGERASKGRRPVNSSYRTTPSENMSLPRVEVAAGDLLGREVAGPG